MAATGLLRAAAEIPRYPRGRGTFSSVIGAPKSRSVEAETGMRRVSWVRVVITDHGAECEAIGVGHRLPNMHRVSLETALALAADGVPAIVLAGAERPKNLLAHR